MATAGGLHAGFGGTDLQFLRLQRRILVGRLVHQFVDVAAVGRHFRAEVRRQATQVDHRLAGQFGQGLVVIGQGVLRNDGVGARLVVLGACFVHVGDRRQAHFQALVGEVELLLRGRFIGLCGVQRFDRHQHVEVGRRGAHDQAVVGRVEGEVRRLAQFALRTQVVDLGPVEQRLAAVDRVVAALAGERARIDIGVRLTACAVQRGLAIDLRQQGSARLHGAFLVDQPGRFGGGQLRIAVARHLIDLQQVGGMGGQRQQGSGQRNSEGSADHCGFLGLRGGTGVPGRHRAGNRYRFRTAIRCCRRP
ncbi:hypothetical protein G6F22_015572 [Rhizopus arrhizus]|nr:hypothetical protein G6F22_015572 [Rhizopus arrhizus]